MQHLNQHQINNHIYSASVEKIKNEMSNLMWRGVLMQKMSITTVRAVPAALHLSNQQSCDTNEPSGD